MKDFDFEHIFIFQNLYHATSALAVMTDSTFRTIAEMYNWHYTTKYEMKHLGGTITQITEKFVELSTLGISKMVEDFFNNLDRLWKIKLSIWSHACDSVVFSREVRLLRHLGNVIKHNNSIIDSSTDRWSSKALINEYGFENDTPIQWIEIFSYPQRDSILRHIYMAYQFCTEILNNKGIFSLKKKDLNDDQIVPYMLKFFDLCGW